MIIYHGKPTKCRTVYWFHFEKIVNDQGFGNKPPIGNWAYGCRLLWAVDMSTPLDRGIVGSLTLKVVQ